MPNGKTHDKITFIILPIIIITAYFFIKDVKLISILIISYLFSSLMFNGDLDCNSSAYNRWWLLKMVWIPYQLMFNHRSVFSHGILIGTVVRLIYLSLIIVPIIYFGFNIKINLNIFLNSIFLIIFAGLEIGNVVHTISDRIF
jgi:uncharacterized metal-binding protein